MVLQMVLQGGVRLGHCGRRQQFAGLQIMGNFAKQPRAAHGGAANHQRIGASGSAHSGCFLRAVNIAIGNDRNANGGFDRRNGVVLGQGFVALLACAPVYGQHGNAGAFGFLCQLHSIAALRRPAGAHLQRNGHPLRQASCDNGFDDLQGQRFVLHQGRAGPFFAHFFGRAAHVDIDDLRAPIDVVAGGFGHLSGVDACNLHGDGAGFACMIGAARGFQAVPQIAAGSHHFADGIACSKAAAQLPKRPIRHPCHRGDKQRVFRKEMTDLHEAEKDKSATLYLLKF